MGISNGLAAVFPFDTGATVEETKNHNSGIIELSLGATDGYVNGSNALQYNGSSSYYTTSDNEGLDSTNGKFSIVCGIKPLSPVQSGVIAVKMVWNVSGYRFDINGVGNITVRAADGTNMGNATTSSTVNVDAWNHLIICVDGPANTWSVYIDGVKETGTFATAITTVASNSAVFISGQHSGGPWLLANVDHLYLYNNQCLNQSDADKLYNNGDWRKYPLSSSFVVNGVL